MTENRKGCFKKIMATGLAVAVMASMSAFTQAAVYEVKAGDSLYFISQRNEITINQLKISNQLYRDQILVGESLIIPEKYTVQAGDTIFLLAQRFHTTMETVIQLNDLKSNRLQIGQGLLLPMEGQASTKSVDTQQSLPRVTYQDYYVKSGDTGWSIAIDHAMPFQEFLTLNKLNQNSWLTLGQKIQVAQYHIPINNPDRLNRGTYMDWWTEAQYAFPIGTIAKVTDIQTGLSWNVKRSYGAGHADCEPLTLADTQIMKQAWNGQWSWATRPILVELNGHRIAASANAMPHSIQTISNNGFQGHFCIHFANSIRHADGLTDQQHQRSINVAAGK